MDISRTSVAWEHANVTGVLNGARFAPDDPAPHTPWMRAPDVPPAPPLPIPAPPVSATPACAVLRPAHGLKRLQHRYELVNIAVNPRQERHELVLDADDLAVGLLPVNGTPLFPMGAVTSGCLLGVACGLAGWFGVVASIREMRDAWRITKNLNAERAYIESVMPDPPLNLWDTKQRRTAQAMLSQIRIDKMEQVLRGVFSGALVTAACTVEICGYLMEPYLFGALSPAAAAAAVPVLSVGVPLLSAFAGANAGLQLARWYRARRDRQFVNELARQSPWPQDQFDADKFVHGRLALIRRQAMITALGFAGIAVGAPLTFFGGPYGLILLVPGVLTVAVANHFETTQIEYTNPLSLEQSLALVTERQICNLMGLAYLEYRSLRRLKEERRNRYLVGSQRGPVLRTLTAPLRGLRRLFTRPCDNQASSLQTLYRFFGERLALLHQYWAHEIDVYQRNGGLDDPELADLLRMAEEEARFVNSDWHAWQREAAALDRLPPEIAVTRLCETLVEFELFNAFIVRVADHAGLRNLLGISRHIASEVSAQQLIEVVARSGAEEAHLTEALFEVAESMFLTTVKHWRHSRAREMADLGVQRKRVKCALPNETLALLVDTTAPVC